MNDKKSAIFRLRNNPEYLATSDLLTELRNMGTLLRPFGIGSNYLHKGAGAAGFRGYLIKNFQDAWERYLPPLGTIVELDEVTVSPFGNAAPFGMKIASETASETAISAIGAD